MSKRTRTEQKPPDHQPAPDAAAAQREQIIQALQQDAGPALLTVAVNMVTGRARISANAQTDEELRALLAGLTQAQAHLQAKLEQAAEARGRMSAEHKKE